MNSINLILLLIIGVLVTDAYGSHCQQIVSGPEVDFKQVFHAAPWFPTYSVTRESFNDNDKPPKLDCIRIVGGRVLTDKIEIDFHNDNSRPGIPSQFEIRHNITGVYVFSKKSEVKLVNDELKREGSENRMTGKDLTIGGERSLILTDYVNYLASATCSSEGDWFIWIYTPTPIATAEQLNLARNRLAEYKICAQTLPSNCGKLAKKRRSE